MHKALVVVLISMLALASTARADQTPADVPIDEAFSIHVSDAGLQLLADTAVSLIPTSVGFPDQGGKLFDCLVDECDWEIKNGNVTIQITNARIYPKYGMLHLQIDALIGATARVTTNGCLFNNGCSATIDPSPVSLSTALGIVLAGTQKNPRIEISIPAFDVVTNVADPDIDDCFLAEFFEFFAEKFVDDAVDALEKTIEQDVAPQLEAPIEELLNTFAFNVGMQSELLGIEGEIFVSQVLVGPEGLTLIAGGHVRSVEPHPCTRFGPKGSRFTPGMLPKYQAVSPTGAPYHVAFSLGDDLINQAFYGVWRGGYFCRDMGSFSDGTPLLSEAFAAFGREVIELLTPERPVLLRLRALEPPYVVLDDKSSEIFAEEITLDVIGDVHDRMTRLMSFDMDGNGELNVQLANDKIGLSARFGLAPTASILYNELLPETEDVALQLLPMLMEQSGPEVSGVFPPFGIPATDTINVNYRELALDGPNEDFLSVYLGFGPLQFE